MQNPRREIAIGIGIRSRENDTSLLGKDFPLSPGADDGGYRQDAMLADGGIFASAELRYPIGRTRDKQGVLQVTPFVDFGNVWNPRGSAVLEPNTLLSAGLRLRWL